MGELEVYTVITTGRTVIMEWAELVRDAVQYVENHITEDITISAVFAGCQHKNILRMASGVAGL